MAMPVVFTFAGLAVEKSSDLLGERFGNRARYVLGMALALWIVSNAVWTYHDYFKVWPQEDQVQNFHQSNLADMARYLDDSGSRVPTSICTEFLNEQDPFWRSGRQSLPFLLNRKDLDLRWFDCRFAYVLPGNGDTVRYLFPETMDFAAWLPVNWPSITNKLNTPIESGYHGVEVDSGEASKLVLDRIDRPSADVQTVILGEMVEFLGYEISSGLVNPGKSFDLYTYWRVIKKLPPELLVFVHLMAEDDKMVAQGDALSLLSDTLQPGDIVIQSHEIAIPAGVEMGQHKLSTGVYSRIGAFPPLQIVSPLDDSSQGERIWLTSVNVSEP